MSNGFKVKIGSSDADVLSGVCQELVLHHNQFERLLSDHTRMIIAALPNRPAVASGVHREPVKPASTYPQRPGENDVAIMTLPSSTSPRKPTADDVAMMTLPSSIPEPASGLDVKHVKDAWDIQEVKQQEMEETNSVSSNSTEYRYPQQKNPVSEAPSSPTIRRNKTDISMRSGSGDRERVTVWKSTNQSSLKDIVQSRVWGGKAKSQKTGWQKRLAHIVQSTSFEAASSVAVVGCAISIGAEVEWDSQNSIGQTPSFFVFLDLFWNIIFTVELMLRWCAVGCYFLSSSNPELGWNVVDIALIGSSLVENIVSSTASTAGINISTFRILRMLRLVRVMRLARVARSFRDLRVMVKGMTGSALSLLWALVLLAGVMFAFAVFFMQIAHVHDFREHEKEELDKLYGSLYRTMLTLFQAISGGMDWSDALRPLTPIGWPMEIIFSAYVFFVIFCSLNIVTAIFVDNAAEFRKADEDAMHEAQMKENKQWIMEIARLFAKIDTSNDGEFTFDEFNAQITTNQRVQTCFAKIGIDLQHASPDELWELLDLDSSGSVDIDEFANSIRHFQGQAKSIDVYKIRKENKRIQSELRLVYDLIAELFGRPTRDSLDAVSQVPQNWEVT